MTISETDIRNLPLPTREQHLCFVQHLRDVHSWYKHLSLLTGNQFVVFLNPKAGVGYPTQHPRLPYGNTVEGYRQAFGYLDFNRRLDDGADFPNLPLSLVEQCRFVLYPYVSCEFYWSVHEDVIEHLRAGGTHPFRDQVLAWKDCEEEVNYAEMEISEQMRSEWAAYRLHQDLQIQEVQRIEKHLYQLYEWHGGLGEGLISEED